MCSSVNINRTSTFLHPSIFPSSQTWFLNSFTSNTNLLFTNESGNQLTQLLQAVGAHPSWVTHVPILFVGVSNFVRRKDLKSKGAKTTKDFAYDQGQLLLHKGHHNFKAFFSFSRAFFYFKSQTLLSLFFEEKLDVINIKYQWPLTFCSRVVLSVFSAGNN